MADRLTVFLDASVVFAATASVTGASHEILQLIYWAEVLAFVSKLVIEETGRNLARKQPSLLSDYHLFLATIPFHSIEPSEADVMAMTPFTVLKDAPILAAARVAQVDYLITLDRRHLVAQRALIEQQTGVKILLPSEFLERLRQSSK